jgi:hypothetical protein
MLHPFPRCPSTSLSQQLLGLALVVSLNLIGSAPAFAQRRLATLDDVQREVRTGDIVSVVRTTGRPMTGKLVRFDGSELDIQPRGSREVVTIPLGDLRSLERPRDSSQNGALIGASIGGGIVLGPFLWAVAVDRNEIDEWGGGYAGAAVIFTGVGALIGWAIDRAHSKPHVRYDAASATSTTIRVAPLFVHGPGIGVVVSF